MGVIYFALDIRGSKDYISYVTCLKGDHDPMMETVTNTQAPLGCVNRKTLTGSKMGQSLGEKEAGILLGGRQAGRI